MNQNVISAVDLTNKVNQVTMEIMQESERPPILNEALYLLTKVSNSLLENDKASLEITYAKLQPILRIYLEQCSDWENSTLDHLYQLSKSIELYISRT